MKRKTRPERPSVRSARLPLNAVRVFEAVAAQRSFSAARPAARSCATVDGRMARGRLLTQALQALRSPARPRRHGLALGRWSLAADEIAEGHVVLAHPQALRFARSYYFVCPDSYLTLPNVAAFREWLIAVAESSPKPAG